MAADFRTARALHGLRSRFGRFANRLLIAGLIVASWPQFAPAVSISVGSNPHGGTVSQFTYQTDYAAWLVADLSDPITPASLEISPGLDAGRWTQELGFGQGFPNLRTGDTFFLQEFLTVGAGDFALRNWSQEILTPGWKWSDGSVFDRGTSEPVSGLGVNLGPTLASFTFDPILAGTDLLVVKVLEYTGPDDVAATPITVQAFTVVPEPGSVTLLGLGIVALLGFGWSRGLPPTASRPRTAFPPT